MARRIAQKWTIVRVPASKSELINLVSSDATALGEGVLTLGFSRCMSVRLSDRLITCEGDRRTVSGVCNLHSVAPGVNRRALWRRLAVRAGDPSLSHTPLSVPATFINQLTTALHVLSLLLMVISSFKLQTHSVQ